VKTVASVVARNARARPEGIAFVEAASGEAMTWAEYDDRSSHMVRSLGAPGDRVALQIADGPGVHTAMLACEKAGIVAVGIGARAGEREVAHLVERSAAIALLREPPLPSAVGDEHPIGPDDLWFLNSTSGTTGLPKIVMHTQARWFAFHHFADRVAHFRDDDVFCSVLPAPFGFGLWTAHFSPAIAGAACVVCARFDPEVVLAAIARYRVTVLAAVSTQFVMMLNSPAVDRYDLSSLRIMFTGGEMVPYERAKEFEGRTGAHVLQFYGSNETGALSCTTPDDPQEKRLRTAGKVIPEMHVRLLDADTGADLTGPGAVGVPAGKGPTLCLGYYDDEAANAALFTDDGWMRMGDLATIDADGYLTVVGRTSDVIIRGGKNISAAQVEDEVATHPAIALCAAVAVTDETFGERVCVFVQMRAGRPAITLDELRAHLEQRGTGKELWPERLVVMDALPRSSGAKVAKGELRALARAGSPSAVPRPIRYRSPDEDSGRWLDFDFRKGDIVISTRSKSGTTWMQMICALLVFQQGELPAPLADLSPWIDWLAVPSAETFARLSAQQHRRFVKTHTPLDGIPLDPRATYIVVARHPLDLAVSLYFQGDNLDRALMRELTGAPEPAPRPPLREWLLAWIDNEADPRAEMDSLPGVLSHLTDAWARRGDTNVVLVHYDDLAADLGGEMRRLARELEIEVPTTAWPGLVEAAGFEHMRARAEDLAPDPVGVLEDRARFFRRGSSGAGRELLSDAEHARYLERTQHLAPPDLLAWLHRTTPNS
jgi:acyl-CoA synthetase